jgi:hypothetical protein
VKPTAPRSVFPLRPPAALFVEDHAGARAPMAFMDFGASMLFRVTSMLTKHIELPKK